MSPHSNDPFDGLDLEARLVKNKKHQTKNKQKNTKQTKNPTKPHSNNKTKTKKPKADWRNCYVDGNSLTFQERREEIFFFRCKMHKCKKLLSLEKFHQMEALFEGISKSINVAQTGSGVTLYRLSSHSWRPLRPSQPEFQWYFISYRNCISEHVLKENVMSLSFQGPRQQSKNQLMTHVISLIQAHFPLQSPGCWRGLGKGVSVHPS